MFRTLALLALLAAAARAKDIPIEAIAAAYSTAIPACNGVLFPQLKDGVLAAAKACWGPIDTAVAAPPTQCPADCRAFAAALGPDCWNGFHIATGAVAAAHIAALQGGAALPAAEVAKLQRVADSLTAADPVAHPRVDVAAGIKAPDAAAVAALKKDAAYTAALAAACFPPFLPPSLPAPAPPPTQPVLEEFIFKVFADKMPACTAVLSPASDEVRAAVRVCRATTLSWEVANWTECTDACRAAAALWGADCFTQYNSALAETWARAGAALAGGEKLPPAEVARIQANMDVLTALLPLRWPALNLSAQVEDTDIALGATTAWWSKAYYRPLLALCAPGPSAGPVPAPTPTPAGGGCAREPLPNLTIPSAYDLGAPAPAASAGACCARCARVAGCRAWVLNPKGACQLKSEAAFQYKAMYYAGRA
jgi:hypothetical protein